MVCHYHGSKSPQAIAAAERRHVEGAAADLTARIDLRDAEPLTDPLHQLAKVAGEIVALKDRLIALVAQADISDPVLLTALDSALDRAARLLVDIARIGVAVTRPGIDRSTADNVIRMVRGAVDAGGGDPEVAAAFIESRLEELADDER